MNWINKSAEKIYHKLVKIYGKPRTLSTNKEGIAIWSITDIQNKKIYGEKNCFDEIMLRDEAVRHLCPKKHYDYLYSSVIVRVDPSQVGIIKSISGSLYHDPLKNYLTARCATIDANIATLKLATDLLLDRKINYKDYGIKYHNLETVHQTGAYGKMITLTKNKKFTKMIYKELVENVNKLRTGLNKGFWKAAFSIEDNKCYPPDKANKIYLSDA